MSYNMGYGTCQDNISVMSTLPYKCRYWCHAADFKVVDSLCVFWALECCGLSNKGVFGMYTSRAFE